MESKLTLDQQKILQKAFTRNVKGYDPDEVDDFLDEIIKDYGRFAAFQEECQAYINSLETQNAKIKKENKELEADNSNLHRKLDGIKEGDKVTKDNLELLDKIDLYEKFLYKQGFDVKKIKLN